MYKKVIWLILVISSRAWTMSPLPLLPVPSKVLEDAVDKHDLTHIETLIAHDEVLDPHFVAQRYTNQPEFSVFEDQFFHYVVEYYSYKYGWAVYGKLVEQELNKSTLPCKADRMWEISTLKNFIGRMTEYNNGELVEEECSKLRTKIINYCHSTKAHFKNPHHSLITGKPVRPQQPSQQTQPPQDLQGDGSQVPTPNPQPLPQQTPPQAPPVIKNSSSPTTSSPTVNVSTNIPVNFTIYLCPNPFAPLTDHLSKHYGKYSITALLAALVVNRYIYQSLERRKVIFVQKFRWMNWECISDPDLQTMSSDQLGPIIEKEVRRKYAKAFIYGENFMFRFFFNDIRNEIEALTYYIERGTSLKNKHLGGWFGVDEDLIKKCKIMIPKLEFLKKTFIAWLKEHNPNIHSSPALMKRINESSTD